MPVGIRSLPNNRAEVVGQSSEEVQSAAKTIAQKLQKLPDIKEVKIGKSKRRNDGKHVVQLKIITK